MRKIFKDGNVFSEIINSYKYYRDKYYRDKKYRDKNQCN